MKKTFKLLLAATLLSVTFGAVSCSKDGDERESTRFSFIFDGETLDAGQTIRHTPTQTELQNNLATVEFLIKNKTENEINGKVQLEKIDGPVSMDTLTIHIGQSTSEIKGNWPWKSENIAIAPGVNQNKKIKIDYKPSGVTAYTKYRFVVGEGGNLSDPEVIFIELKER